MQNSFYAPFEMFTATASLISKSVQAAPELTRAAFAQTRAAQYYWSGIYRYVTAFMKPTANALNAFVIAERTKIAEKSPAENLEDYLQLFDFNVQLAGEAITSSLKAMNGFFYATLGKTFSAWLNTIAGEDGIGEFSSRLEEVLKVTVNEYPKAVEEIKTEFGLHLDNGGYVKVAETERFELYQALPTEKGVTPGNKPILIIPPYVLGANILAFLPEEQRSYVHCYANKGVPTYIRLVKDIYETPAVQTMTGEDDASDIRFFCGELMARHDMPVTLNGFCQGGYLCLVGLLSGELDGIVDALITCVSPVDGSRSKSFTHFLESIPPRFRGIEYSQKVLPDGNTVIDGAVLSWVQRLRKLETESPIVAFHRDISMFESQPARQPKIGKTAAAINYWLTYEQYDLPVNIAQMSFASYSIPIDDEGILPSTLFGRKLNLKRLAERKTPWLICIAAGDDLVDKEASLAALNYIDAEVCTFPKGHASIATSWSIPTSACALHILFPALTTVPDGSGKMSRGPVRFHMDLETAIQAARKSDESVHSEEPAPAIELEMAYAGDEAFQAIEAQERVEAPAQTLVTSAGDGNSSEEQAEQKHNALPTGVKEETEGTTLPSPTPTARKGAGKTRSAKTAPKGRSSRKVKTEE